MVCSSKLLLTLVTRVLLFWFMNSFMFSHCRLCGKTFRTKRTEERPVAVIVPPHHMSGQGTGHIEALLTLGTFKGFHSTVDSHMCLQRGFLAKSLTTSMTHERLVSSMFSNVILKLEHFTEIFSTESTHSLSLRLGQQMNLFMDNKLNLSIKRLTAYGTFIVFSLFLPFNIFLVSFRFTF